MVGACNTLLRLSDLFSASDGSPQATDVYGLFAFLVPKVHHLLPHEPRSQTWPALSRVLLYRSVATPQLMIHALHNIANHATAKLCVIYLDDVALQTLSCAASTAQTVDGSAVTVDRTRHAR